MTKLTIFCGIPGSGKSTFYKKYDYRDHWFDSTIRISLDDFRKLMTGKDFHPPFEPVVQAWAEQTGRYLLSQGHHVVVDATYVRRSLRQKWVKLAQEYRAGVECVWFNIPWHVCVERNDNRERKVPVDVLKRMSENFEEPSLIEGFDRLFKVDENGDYDEIEA